MVKFKIAFNYLKRLVEKRKRFVLVALILIILVGAFYTRFNEDLSKEYISEGVIGTYQEKDLPNLVTNLLSSGLVKIDKSGIPVNDLAKEVNISEDGKTYTVKLKDNLTWVDETMLKSSDIQFSIPDAEVKYPDDKTIQFTISDNFSPFPTLLDKPAFKKSSLIGIGPYYVSQIKKDKTYVKKLILKPVKGDRPDIYVYFYQNEKLAKDALALGEIRMLMGITDLSGIKGQAPIDIVSLSNHNQLAAVFYNTKDAILSDENFRLALSYAAPSIKGEEEARTSISSSSWAFNTEVKDYLDNPTQAKASLSRVKNGRDSTITLTVIPPLDKVGQQIVDSWNAQGIKSVMRVESGIPQNFQALLITHPIPQDPDQYTLWHSTQTQTNISKISLPRVDKDLEDGRKTLDTNIRKQRYQDFQKVLLDHAPATFLYFPKYNIAYYKKIQPLVGDIIRLQTGNP